MNHELAPTPVEARIPLLLSPTDTDSHASVKAIFANPSESNRLSGPCICDGDTIQIQYKEPELFVFKDHSGVVQYEFMVKQIEGLIQFTPDTDSFGNLLQSAPVSIDFLSGSILIAKEGAEDKEIPFVDCPIEVRAYVGDTISVRKHAQKHATPVFD
jgi:hypothetical protein